jgi:spore maturation protein CgeB
MNFVVVGNFALPWHETPFVRALERMGHDVTPFSWPDHFRGLWVGLQQKYRAGPAMTRVGQGLCETVRRVRPDVVLVWRGNHLARRALERVRSESRALLVSYYNDNPFGLTQGQRWRYLSMAWRVTREWRAWGYAIWAVLYHAISSRVFVNAISAYDLHFVYRTSNVSQFRACGAKWVEVLLPYFVPELHHPVKMTREDRERFGCEIAFVGHCEPDQRIPCVDALVAAGADIRVYGTHWPQYAHKYGWDDAVFRPPVFGEDYCRAIAGAHIALAFYSTRHRDPYTRRCFEIPAIGTCMLAERSRAMLELFREDQEAAYFADPEQLVCKARWLLSDDAKRHEIADRALRRVYSVGGDVYSWTENMVRRLQVYLGKSERSE